MLFIISDYIVIRWSLHISRCDIAESLYNNSHKKVDNKLILFSKKGKESQCKIWVTICVVLISIYYKKIKVIYIKKKKRVCMNATRNIQLANTSRINTKFKVIFLHCINRNYIQMFNMILRMTWEGLSRFLLFQTQVSMHKTRMATAPIHCVQLYTYLIYQCKM